jgi:SH3-like domain-containing protein
MPTRSLAAAVLAALLGAAAPLAAADPGEAAEAAEAEAEARGPVTKLPLPRFVSLRAEAANARRGPSLDQRVDWKFVRPGLPLEVTAEYGHWRRVRDAEGAGGWIHHSLLSGARTVVVEAEGLTPLHADPTEAAPVRAYLEAGVIARLDACSDDWCAVAASGTDGWISRKAVWGAD